MSSTRPSIGLHPRDLNRIVEAMHRLRDAGNYARGGRARSVGDARGRPPDRHGPRPGERGGDIVYDGAPERDIQNSDTPTGAYLGGRKHVARRCELAAAAWWTTSHAALVARRRERSQSARRDGRNSAAASVCVTQVCRVPASRRCIQDVLCAALARHFGKATEAREARSAA